MEMTGKYTFTYGERKDQQVNYIAGAKVNSRKILKQISTYIANVQVKNYQFNYVMIAFILN